jgi:hypothetical protein
VAAGDLDAVGEESLLARDEEVREPPEPTCTDQTIEHGTSTDDQAIITTVVD